MKEVDALTYSLNDDFRAGWDACREETIHIVKKAILVHGDITVNDILQRLRVEL